MGFGLSELGFQPGIFANRSARASKGRWVDGNLVRFSDSVPAQVGGWRAPAVTGVTITGRARDILAWRPNDQVGRYAVVGTNAGAFLYDGGGVSDITPTGFAAGRVDTIAGNGYGGSTYGTSTYGTVRTGSGLILTAGGWTFDMFGEILLGCGIGDGTIYEYLQGTDTKLKAVTNAPKAAAICVSDERHVFAFGCNGNPNLVRGAIASSAPFGRRPRPTGRAPMTCRRRRHSSAASASPASSRHGRRLRRSCSRRSPTASSIRTIGSARIAVSWARMRS
jgi:hypothetical protein